MTPLSIPMTPSIPQITYIPLHYTQTKATWNSNSPLLEKIVRIASALFSETFVNLWNALQNLVTWCQHTMTSASTQPVDPITELLSLLAADRLDVARIHTLMNPGEGLEAIPEITASLPAEEEFQEELAQHLSMAHRIRSLVKLIRSTAQIIQQQSQETPISQELATKEFIRICWLWAAKDDHRQALPEESLLIEFEKMLPGCPNDFITLFGNSVTESVHTLPLNSARTTYSISDATVNELLNACRHEEPELMRLIKTTLTQYIHLQFVDVNYKHNSVLLKQTEKQIDNSMLQQIGQK